MSRPRTSPARPTRPRPCSRLRVPRAPRRGRALLVTVAILGLGPAALGAGCGGRTFWANDDDAGIDDPDAATDPDARVDPDASTDPDGGPPPQCIEDEWWELIATPLDSVTVTSPHQMGGPGLSRGISARVKALVPVGGCDRLAAVQPTVEWATQRIHLASWVWRYHGPAACPEMIALVPEMLVFRDLDPGTWSVWDEFSMDGPGALARLEVQACRVGEDCACNLWDGIPGEIGASCHYDCQCAWPLSCLYEGMLDPEWGGSCQQTCSTDADCPLPSRCLFDVLDMPTGICTDWREGCSDHADCAAGHACRPLEDDPQLRYCQPEMTPDSIGVQCGDDCDCPAGYDCVVLDDTGMRHCQIPCRGNGDCPESLTCEDPGGWWVNNRVCTGWME